MNPILKKNIIEDLGYFSKLATSPNQNAIYFYCIAWLSLPLLPILFIPGIYLYKRMVTVFSELDTLEKWQKNLKEYSEGKKIATLGNIISGTLFIFFSPILIFIMFMSFKEIDKPFHTHES